MSRVRASASLLALLSIISTACAAQPEGGRAGAAQSGTTRPDDSRTLIVVMRTEPKAFVSSDLNLNYTGNTPEAPWQIFHAGLTQQDERGTFHLQLAETFPQLGTDSWKVFPDGRMETTWRLRPNLTWHDGTPLVADDFVFSTPFAKSVRTGGADGVSAPDPRTVVVQYKSPAPEAGEAPWEPLPRHILGPSLEQMDVSEAFSTLPYWTTEFVGAGPYRLEQWEPGAFITGIAFPGYVNGKPGIGRIQLVWVADANTVVANLLSGTVHFATDLSLAFEQASVLRREWAASGEPGFLLLGTAKTVYAQLQVRPEYANPTAMLEVRFRQALAHAIDKQAIVDAVLDGEPGMADTLVAKEEEYYPELDRVLTKYPLDPRRTEQLLSEIGFRKDGEGYYGQSGTRPAVGITPLGDYLREALVLADGWKRAGIEAPVRALSAAEQLDHEIGSTYPATGIIQFAINQNPLQYFTAANTSSAATRWQGRNQGGYFDPETDRLADAATTSLVRSDRNQALVQGMKLLSDQAAYFPLYYGYEAVAHGGSLGGPRAGIKRYAMWKLEEWHWR